MDRVGHQAGIRAPADRAKPARTGRTYLDLRETTPEELATFNERQPRQASSDRVAAWLEQIGEVNNVIRNAPNTGAFAETAENGFITIRDILLADYDSPIRDQLLGRTHGPFH